MNLYDIFQELEINANDENAEQMASYMRNQFSFLGLKTPERRKITTPYFKSAKDSKEIDWTFVEACWEKPYREAQHVVIDYLKVMQEHLVIEDMQKIKSLLVKKSWWDTIDGFHRMIGDMALRYPEIDERMIQWSLDENFWLRRIAITHQMLRKEKMKEELLTEILDNNLDQEEFFINKAIGWTLRDYSKTNPAWVKDYIATNKERLSKLSIREGSKYL